MSYCLLELVSAVARQQIETDARERRYRDIKEIMEAKRRAYERANSIEVEAWEVPIPKEIANQ